MDLNTLLAIVAASIIVLGLSVYLNRRSAKSDKIELEQKIESFKPHVLGSVKLSRMAYDESKGTAAMLSRFTGEASDETDATDEEGVREVNTEYGDSESTFSH